MRKRLIVAYDKDKRRKKRHAMRSLVSVQRDLHSDTIKSIPDQGILIIETEEENISRIRDMEGIDFVEEDGMASICRSVILDEEDGPAPYQWGIGRVNAHAAHRWGITGLGIKIGIVDTGIDTDHPDLEDAYVRGWDCILETEYPEDDNGHGTHVAGIASARRGINGDIGVAPESSLYIAKSLNRNGTGRISDIVQGIDWCIQQNVDIISMSFGAGTNYGALRRVCESAVSKGILLVAAAGNIGENYVLYPGKYPDVIAVSATTSHDILAPFSSWGKQVDLCAPGQGILSTWIGGGYNILNGTSMACPHVSGMSALYMSIYPSFVSRTIARMLSDKAQDLGDPGWDRKYGHGLVRFLCPMRGDLSDDDRVNAFDFILFLKAWNSRRGDKRFNPLADLDVDGSVGISDFFLFAKEYGKTA